MRSKLFYLSAAAKAALDDSGKNRSHIIREAMKAARGLVESGAIVLSGNPRQRMETVKMSVCVEEEEISYFIKFCNSCGRTTIKEIISKSVLELLRGDNGHKNN